MKNKTLFTIMVSSLGLLTLQNASKADSSFISVTPTLETRSHYSDDAGKNTDVDDPAIWIHPSDKSKSLVVTTLKKGGLDVYDLKGKLVQHISPAPAPACSSNQRLCNNKAGRLNNADVVYNFTLNDQLVDLIVVSDRGLDKLAIYTIGADKDKNQALIDVTSKAAPLIFATNQGEINEGLTAYGLATVKTNKTMAFVSQNSTTRVAQLELFEDGNGLINYKSVQNLDFPASFDLPNKTTWTPCSDDDGEYPHFEGMVADPLHDSLYLAQEDVGIWKVKLSNPNDKKNWNLFAKVKKFGIPYTRTWDPAEEEYHCGLLEDKNPSFGNQELIADVEGLTLYDADNGEGYVLVSSQGNNTIAIYERSDSNRFVNSFTIGDGKVDAVNETDGMMVVNVNLGGEFDQGLLVMQDGDNQPPATSSVVTTRESTNFKYIAWRKIAKELKLKISTKDLTRN